MSTTTARPSPGTGTRTAGTALRLLGAALLGTNAGIHAYLWHAGYRTIPTIGWLFLLDAIGASVLTLAVLAAPRKVLPLAALGGTVLEAGTVIGLAVATKHELFGFVESTRATLYWPSAWTEIAGAVVLAALTVLTYRRVRSRTANTGW